MLRSRFRLVAALLAVVVAAVVLPATTATAAVPSCSNSGCPDPTDWSDARWDAHAGYPSFGGTVNGANCTNYVAWRLITSQGFSAAAVSGLGNARTWDERAAAKGYKVDHSPSVGAVAEWENNHVAYVEQVNVDGTIVISESNVWVGNPDVRMWLRHRTISASSVDHFIHFRPANPETVRLVLAPGDFDGDGAADLMAVTGNGRLMLYRGDGQGGLVTPVGKKIAGGWQTRGLVFAAGDFSGDGHPDVFTVMKSGLLYLYRGNGKGGFSGSPVKVASGWQSFDAAFSPGDFTGDGRSDVIVLRSDGRLALYTGAGKSKFAGKPVTIGTGFAAATLVGSTGDFDGDGTSDVIALWPDGSMKLYRGDGAGKLVDATGDAGTEISPYWSDVNTFAGSGDLTGDGTPDLFTVAPDGSLYRHDSDAEALDPFGTQVSVTW